jgi:hypothetical protein
MLVEVVRPRPGGSAAPPAPSSREAAYEAPARLRTLRDDLNAERIAPRRSRWNEPTVFFFHPDRQAELEASRTVEAEQPHPLADRIACAVQSLCESVEVRQAARAVPGLREAAARHPVAKPLAELLAVPDDETVLVLNPEQRLGIRLLVRGVVSVNQFQTLLLDAASEELDQARPPSRFRSACGDANPVIPAGVPMTVNLSFQCFRPAALRPDGSMPERFHGSDQWLWGGEPLAAAPRIDGERTILLGEPAFPQSWDVDRRFPALAAETELLEVLSPFRVAERLSRLAGRPVSVRREPSRREPLAAAA